VNHGSNCTAELDQTNEDILSEVSDETLEAAAGTYIGGCPPSALMGQIRQIEEGSVSGSS
jgi:hypothetical protein